MIRRALISNFPAPVAPRLPFPGIRLLSSGSLPSGSLPSTSSSHFSNLFGSNSNSNSNSRSSSDDRFDWLTIQLYKATFFIALFQVCWSLDEKIGKLEDKMDERISRVETSINRINQSLTTLTIEVNALRKEKRWGWS
ncbi:hypothetical protein TWF718_008383 [Orbilia javanica]|uniref:Uncharacterized protein n=1 Tax=Orbilia javanica TaxID=47235 RepID=A0AAN8N0Y8_9PEZI